MIVCCLAFVNINLMATIYGNVGVSTDGVTLFACSDFIFVFDIKIDYVAFLVNFI